ncbi:hypothetical protein GS501_00450 [Saccharibacter sp. 17.LH.SD]|nr:hypothetical protein [Saccharibacter sp. 17.LH.SD]
MMASSPLFLTLADASWQRAHYGFVLATSALSLGRPTLLFAGGYSVHVFSHTMQGLEGALATEELLRKNVPSLHDLREAFFALDGRAIACETGMKMAGLTPQELVEGVRSGGMIRFLTEVEDHPILAL